MADFDRTPPIDAIELPGEAQQLQRLGFLAKLSPRCAWTKFDHQCTPEELRARETYRKLLAKCSRWETEQGF